MDISALKKLLEQGQDSVILRFGLGNALFKSGQAAESIHLRGTGIGCYFDDGVHELIGLVEDDHTFQSLYHFTIGKALTDNRLQTLPPYAHLQRSNLVRE